MMLLKSCVVVIFISTFRNLLLCDAEEIKVENTTVTSGTGNHTKKFLLKMPLKDYRNATKNEVKKVKLKDGRSATEHDFGSMDGYLLKMIRLSSELPTKKCPVLLVHGMFQSSDRFLNQDKSQSLAYTLDGLGYDVWLFNARGNKYCQTHATYAPHAHKSEFNNYSYEEIGCFDLAAAVDYILKLTTFKKIHYIGHSLGGTFFLVLNSLVTDYNEKFDRAFLMAPLGYHTTITNTNLQKDLDDPTSLHEALIKVDTYEIFPYEAYGPIEDMVPDNCLGGKTWENICNELNIQKIMGIKSNNNTIAETRGGSTKILIHWAQNIKNKKFHRWDFGESKNVEEYDSKDPPEYPLKAITVRTKIIYSSDDDMVKDTDVQTLAKLMKNATCRKVKRANFKHDDFIDGEYVMEDVYNGIIKDLEYPKPLVPRANEVNTKETESKASLPDIPWSALLSLVGILLFMFISLISCCCKKKDTNGACATEAGQQANA
ncbi:lipase 3-like [Cydia splendana]|uniref:lipase 3-like n=1 Tax=Cydia splendana TaxID=1100963 RepID=UPI0028F490C0